MKAIDILVKKRLKASPITTYQEGEVTSIASSGIDQLYTVKIDGEYIEAYGKSNLFLDVGDIVIICIPNNDYSKRFIDHKRNLKTSTSGIPVVEVIASKILALSDLGRLQKCSSSSSIVITIPLNANVDFPINGEIPIYRHGTGSVTISSVAGVTLNSVNNETTIPLQYDMATIKKLDEDEWLLYHDRQEGTSETTYVHPTGDGNLHVPITGETNDGKVLTAGSTEGSAAWETPAVTWSNVSDKPNSTVTDIDLAVTKIHEHSNATVLNNTTASFLSAQETKLGFISVSQAVNLDTMETNIATNNAKVTNATHTGDVTGSTALTIASKAVTLTKMADMATASILGRKTASAGVPEVLSKSDVLTILNLSKGDVGLGNLTNDAQVKKLVSSTSGNVPTWNGSGGDALASGYSVESTLSGAATALPRADAVKTYIDSLLVSRDVMVFKGTLGPTGTYAGLPSTYSIGWSFKVASNGVFACRQCEIGDMIFAIADRVDAIEDVYEDWAVVQTNVDGMVVAPYATSVNNNFAAFDGTSGRSIKDSGYGASNFADVLHNHTGTYTRKYSHTIGDGSETSFVITHNLNTRLLTYSIAETVSPYAVVKADVNFTTVNTLTVEFAVAPTTDAYTITIIG